MITDKTKSALSAPRVVGAMICRQLRFFSGYISVKRYDISIPMVVIINGTLGVGKTLVARNVFSRLDKAFYIEGDSLGFVSADLLESRSRQKIIGDSAINQIKFYRALGVLKSLPQAPLGFDQADFCCLC